MTPADELRLAVAALRTEKPPTIARHAPHPVCRYAACQPGSLAAWLDGHADTQPTPGDTTTGGHALAVARAINGEAS